MTALSINLNKIALIRNSRVTTIPRVDEAARTCIESGADGITVHPRPDMRHVTPDDVGTLAELLAGEYPAIEFNIEGNPFAGPDGDYPGFMELVLRTTPAQCTLVPDTRSQLTSDHGFDLTGEGARLRDAIAALGAEGIRVSLFMDPIADQIRLAKEFGADRIELYTGPYAEAYGTASQSEVFDRFAAAAELAAEAGLGLNAGHDLNQDNLGLFARVRDLAEVSIGHAVVSDAIWHGLAQTVRSYRAILDAGAGRPRLGHEP